MNHPFLFSNILIMENAVFLEYVYNYTKSILSLQNFKLNKFGWSKTLNPIPVILGFFFFFCMGVFTHILHLKHFTLAILKCPG